MNVGAFIYGRDNTNAKFWFATLPEPYDLLASMEADADTIERFVIIVDRKSDRRVNHARGYSSRRSLRIESPYQRGRESHSSKGYTLRSFRNTNAIGGHNAKRERRKLNTRVEQIIKPIPLALAIRLQALMAH